MMLRRVNSLNDLAERAAMLAPFEDTSTSATSSSSSPPSSASSSPVLYSSGLSPLASLASASSAIDLLRATTTQQDMPVPAKPTQPKSAQPGHVREAASGGDKKKRKRETTAAEHLHHAHRHVALRPSLSNSSPGKQTGRDHQAQAHAHAQPQHHALHMSTGNGHHAGYGKAGANGAAVHVVSSSIPRSTSAPSLAHLPLSPPPPASVAVLSPSSMTSPPPPPPVHSAQISPNSIHLRDFMDNTKHLLTVMCQIRDGDAYAKAGAALSDDHQHHQLRLGFGAVVQPVEKASAYWFAEVPSAYEVLRATGLWQRSFLMEVLCQERHLVVDRTLYCGYRRVSQDRFTYFFDSDSETLRQLYAQHSQPAAAAASTPASTLPFATGGGSSSSGMPFRFSPGTSLPALASPSPSPAPMVSTANGTGTGHHLSTSSPALSTLGRHLAPTPHTASQPLALAANDGRPRAGSPADRVSRHHESEAHNGHHHRHHNELGSGGCCVKEEELEEDDDDADDDFYLLKAAYAHADSAEEGDSFEQPPAKLFLLPEYCYFDPTVLKKRSIRCIPCKVSLSKMGWKQHMLSAEHTAKKAKFNARGQSTQQADELVYRSTRGMLTCLACAVLLPPEDFGKHVAGNLHAKKRKGWALLDHIERWSDILSKKPRYSTATPLSPTLGSSTTSTSVTPLSPTFGATSTSAAAAAAGSLGSSGSSVLVDLHDPRSSGSNSSEHQTSTIAAAGSAELAELFHVECYPMTPVTGYTQWVALHSTRNWDARNFEVLITTRGKQDRLVVEPLSWKTTTSRGFLFNLAVKFERTYGPDPVLLCLVIRDTMGAMVQGHEQEIQIPLGRAIVCSNSSQRLKRLQQLGEESALTDTEQRVIPHYTQCALVHKGREHRYRVKPLATVLAAVATVPTSNVPTTPATVPATRAPSPTSSSSSNLSSSSGPVAVTSKASPSVSVLSASLPVATTPASMLSSTLSSSSSASALFSPAAATPTTASAPAASSLTMATPMTSPLHRRLSSLSSSSSSHHHHQAPLTSPSSTSPAPRQPLIVKTSS